MARPAGRLATAAEAAAATMANRPSSGRSICEEEEEGGKRSEGNGGGKGMSVGSREDGCVVAMAIARVTWRWVPIDGWTNPALLKEASQWLESQEWERLQHKLSHLTNVL